MPGPGQHRLLAVLGLQPFEAGGIAVQAVQGRMTGRVYRRETDGFGGAWFWGTERGQWVVWKRLLDTERVAEALEVDGG